jgi:hypothetical protein
MHRQILEACAPWLAVLLVAVVALRWLVVLSGARWRMGALKSLHRDEAGAVQSLSFVLTLPVFVMIMMLIVQVSQVMIATVVVHYAAFAAARAAIVWIPAETNVFDEGANRISSYAPDADAGIEGDGPSYTVDPSGAKFQKIRLAAALACMPIAPSRHVGVDLPASGGTPLAALRELMRSASPQLEQNPQIETRLRNKLAYSLVNTEVKLSFLHPENEPPLADWDVLPEHDEFHYNELGWQDIIRVTVTHELALLPGPGRLLARSTSASDAVSRSIDQRGNVYVRSLSASVTLGNEGEKSVRPYRQYLR